MVLIMSFVQVALSGTYIWDKVFKNGPSKICRRQPLSRPYAFKVFKGCIPQILLGPFLNTLSHIPFIQTEGCGYIYY